MGAMMLLLAEKGNGLRKPYTEQLEDGIFELRAIQGNNISRALFFFYVGKRIIITMQSYNFTTSFHHQICGNWRVYAT